jgi:glycosyltransferase involved in cell wall biosynthesis
MRRLLTVLSACFNAQETIGRACLSVDAQKLPPGLSIEHLILDGDSSDETLERVAAHESHRRHTGAGPSVERRVLTRPDNGLYDALNTGLTMARGDVIGLLNADDFLANEDVISRITDLFTNTETDGVYGDLLYVKRRNGCLTQHRYWRSGEYSQKAFRNGWMPPHPTLYLRRKMYEHAGGFRTDFASAADYEFMVRLMRLTNLTLAYVPEVLVCMKVGGMSNSSLHRRWLAHRMDCKAWTENKLSPGFLTLLLKPLRKLPQFWRRHKKFVFPDWAHSAA